MTRFVTYSRPAVIFATQLLIACTACVDEEGKDSRQLPSSPTGSQAIRGHQPKEPRPNVVIIITDDQRWDTMGAMPQTVRWFQEGGVTYTSAFAVTPLCCPSRASIFTGQYPHNHGVLNNFMPEKLDQNDTLQAMLQRRHYGTAIVGKFLNGWDLEVDPPHFDQWAIFDNNYQYYGVVFNVNGAVRTVPGYSTNFIETQAIRQLRVFEHTDSRPFLLYVTPFAAHNQFVAEPRYAHAQVEPWKGNPATRERDRSDKPKFVQSSSLHLTGGQRIRRRQVRTLYSVDDLVGRLMRELRRLDELDSTLAFFLSDSGHFWAEHGLGDKRFPYTQGVHVPFLIRYPGHLPSGVADDRLVATIDVTPTSLAAARIELQGDSLDGRNLLGPPRRHLLLEYFEDPVFPVPEWSAVRTPDYQYVEYQGGEDQMIYREYYDLTQDRWMLTNLLHDGERSNDPSSFTLRRLSRLLARDRVCRGSKGRRACP